MSKILEYSRESFSYSCFHQNLQVISQIVMKGSRSHTQFRLKMCPLNYYLYKIGCVESTVCTCYFKNETISHFLLECLIYAHLRRELLLTITPLFHKLSNSNVPTNLSNFLLYGSDELSYLENAIVFKNVGQFITASKRI